MTVKEKIIKYLEEHEEATFCEMANNLGIPKGSVSGTCCKMKAAKDLKLSKNKGPLGGQKVMLNQPKIIREWGKKLRSRK